MGYVRGGAATGDYGAIARRTLGGVGLGNPPRVPSEVALAIQPRPAAAEGIYMVILRVNYRDCPTSRNSHPSLFQLGISLPSSLTVGSLLQPHVRRWEQPPSAHVRPKEPIAVNVLNLFDLGASGEQ